MCCRNYLKCQYSGRVCSIVDALWFGKSSDAGSNFIVEFGLRTGDPLGNCLEKLTSVLRNSSHRGHRMLLLQKCNHQIFSDCPLFFIPGTKVTKCVFSSSLSEGGGLFVYTKPWRILCYLVIRTKHSGAKERYLRERSIKGPLPQTSHPVAEGSAVPGAGLAFFLKNCIYLY